ncbi:MAG: hypothetical protein GY851_18710 [bacterium]|nr:hypothetical protein [bacterium]
MGYGDGPDIGPWEYMMAESESIRWRASSDDERRAFLLELGPRVYREARDHHREQFAVYDVDGSLIALGGLAPRDALTPYDVEESQFDGRRN